MSLTCILCECLEKLIRPHICRHITEYGWLHTAPRGFLKGSSCLPNLLSFLGEVTAKLYEGKVVEVCYLAFWKALDSVKHRSLMHRLDMFGIPGKLLQWVKGCLSDVWFSVSMGNENSLQRTITRNVSQASLIGLRRFSCTQST